MSRYRSRTRLAALLSAAGGGGPLLGQDAIDNMISWWKLDEESGVRADAHGSQDLTDGNTVLYGTGKQGNAALFNKVNNESLSIGNGAGNRLATGDFTVWGWFNSGVPSGTCPLFFKKFEYLVEFQNSNNRTPKVQLGSGGGWTTGGPVWGTALNLDTWYFICAWHDVSAKTLYLQINDGTPVSGVYTGTGGNSTNTMNLAFQDSAKDFGGLMDEFGISRTILTAADRAALYNSGDGITYEQATGNLELSAEAKAAMVSWWKLDEESGVRADAHGSYNLTDINTVSFAAGKQGNAADFEADDDEHLSHADTPDLQGGNQDWAIACWYNVEEYSGGAFPLMSKWTSSSKDYILYASTNGNGKPRVSIGDGAGSALRSLDWGTALETGTWYLVIAWHDASEKTLHIQINDSAPVDGAAYTGTAAPGNPGYFIGRAPATSTVFDGLIDEAVFFQGGFPDATDRTKLYNLGAGITYEQATGA